MALKNRFSLLHGKMRKAPSPRRYLGKRRGRIDRLVTSVFVVIGIALVGVVIEIVLVGVVVGVILIGVIV